MNDEEAMRSDVAHVWPGDGRFKGRMRFHQSWYREKLGLDPSTNPSSNDKSALFGSRLTPKDGAAGANFLSGGIARVAQERLKENKNLASEQAQSRLLCDMLSSQPMCFNLFGPLVIDHELATRLLRLLPGVPADMEVTRVALEYAPEPATSYLDDKTSHDVFVEYRRPGGNHGFIGIETKLTEPFTRYGYSFRGRYSRWMKTLGWWWNEGAEEHFSRDQYNQLWRNHLLAFSMLNQEPPTYSEAFAAVLYHDNDVSCPRAMVAYRTHLRPEAQGTLLDWPLGMVLDTWEDLLRHADERSWLTDFRLRYWDLAASQPAWAKFTEKA